MFAINHAAAALLIRRRSPDVPLVPVLLSVQAMEVLWVLLNYLGVERTTTENVVRYVGDIHLAFMPYSHSVLTMTGAAVITWAIASALGRPRLGVACGLGVVSHLVLDLATHNGDIALGPWMQAGGYGTYLYRDLPAVAFAVELAFGLVCWWADRGSRRLLAVIVGFNLANLSMFFSAIPGPEALLVGQPTLIVTVIVGQIAVTLTAVWWAARRSSAGSPSW